MTTKIEFHHWIFVNKKKVKVTRIIGLLKVKTTKYI